ncbi:MAG: biotin--[acetyl-CoA-carboxylase] ligase [Demequinaceae bacterium]|nr:biotin--[acetyl-CoA-carboxylase] ligase [Demequinaceae bacterium]
MGESRRPLDIAHLTRTLTAPVGPLPKVTVVKASPSTNADLVEGLKEGAQWPHLSALVAEWQTAGHGRSGRSWETPKGTALTVSFVVRPRGIPNDRLGWVPLIAGLAVVRTLKHDGLEASLKWPNDVLVMDPLKRRLSGWGPARKVAGILCEAVGEAIVVGIGLNVSQEEQELPVPHAISLALAQSTNLDRASLLAGIATELGSLLSLWESEGGEGSVPAEVVSACDTIGRAVEVDRPGGSHLSGVAKGLSPEGGLIVEMGAGWVETVLAGDVQLRVE